MQNLWTWNTETKVLSVPALAISVYADSYDEALDYLCAILGAA